MCIKKAINMLFQLGWIKSTQKNNSKNLPPRSPSYGNSKIPDFQKNTTQITNGTFKRPPSLSFKALAITSELETRRQIHDENIKILTEVAYRKIIVNPNDIGANINLHAPSPEQVRSTLDALLQKHSTADTIALTLLQAGAAAPNGYAWLYSLEYHTTVRGIKSKKYSLCVGARNMQTDDIDILSEDEALRLYGFSPNTSSNHTDMATLFWTQNQLTYEGLLIVSR